MTGSTVLLGVKLPIAQILWLIVLVFATGLFVACYIAYRKIRKKLRDFSQEAFGTTDFAQGFKRQAEEISETPKSVTGMTKLMEPLIAKDFPDFSWPQFKQKAENMLTGALNAISSSNIDLLRDASKDLHNQVYNIIQGNLANDVTETFSNLRIHQTEIANYKKTAGKCVITIQSAVEYYHFKEKNGKIIEGSRDRKEQKRYNMDLVSIQDESLMGTDGALGAHCPNCGAAVIVLGNKYCEYCGAGLQVLNTKIWSLQNYYEADYNHI